ncbi:hypothetical protein [Collimonas silvisoli]|uniref:hypothetical protein n=1 Tax=Collimonas silvisoli TaxID=2825884 RepID=UPI001B8C5A10|nr:hypothetical protein [Collimonas silvisoli]
MTISIRFFLRLLSSATLAGCACQSVATERLQFDGIPWQPTETLVQDLNAGTDGVMKFELSPQHSVKIFPWPSTLPRHLQAQYVTVRQTMHPAGAMQSLVLRTAESKLPWLTLMSNGNLRWQLLPGVRLMQNEDGGIDIRGLARDFPVRLKQTMTFHDQAMHCWQFVLLDSRVPEETLGIAQEKEPRVDWYLRRDISC